MMHAVGCDQDPRCEPGLAHGERDHALQQSNSTSPSCAPAGARDPHRRVRATRWQARARRRRTLSRTDHLPGAVPCAREPLPENTHGTT